MSTRIVADLDVNGSRRGTVEIIGVDTKRFTTHGLMPVVRVKAQARIELPDGRVLERGDVFEVFPVSVKDSRVE